MIRCIMWKRRLTSSNMSKREKKRRTGKNKHHKRLLSLRPQATLLRMLLLKREAHFGQFSEIGLDWRPGSLGSRVSTIYLSHIPVSLRCASNSIHVLFFDFSLLRPTQIQITIPACMLPYTPYTPFKNNSPKKLTSF